MILFVCFLALVHAVTLRSVSNGACAQTGRESFRVFADLAPNELLRAVDANLVAASGTSIVLNNLQPGGAAPVPPTLPGETCNSYVAWNRINSGVDLTWITPDFRWTTTSVAKGWFLSDPLSSQAPPAGSSVQIAQFTIQTSSTGPCDSGPSLSGTLNLITNGTRQNPQTVCLGSGCTPNTLCEFVSGYLTPSVQVPASGFGTPTRAYHLVRGSGAPIALDVTDIAGNVPIVARNATLGLATAVVNGLRRALQVTYITTGEESKLLFNSTSIRRVLVTVVRLGGTNQCTTTTAMGVIRDRQYSASQYIASISNGRISIQPTVQQVTISLTGLPTNFNSCGNIDHLVTQALGVSPSQFDHRIHLLPSTAICGRIASSVGAPPGLGGWSVFANAISCDSIDGVLHGLFRQFGLGSSDALAADQSVRSFGDGACMLGRVPTAEGVHRRNLNALQLFNLGALPSSRVYRATATPLVVRLYTPSFPNTSEQVTQLIDMSLDFFASYRATSDPGVDRQANFAQASSDGNPLSVPSYSGRVLIHRRISDGSTRLVTTLGVGDSYSSLGVINVQVHSVDRYSAVVLVQFPSVPGPLPSTPIPAEGSVYVDALPADTAMQSSAGGRNPVQSYSDSSLLNLGINDADNDPYVYIRLRVPIPRFARITQASLLLETSSRQTVATNGELYLEVAYDAVDNSAALTAGSNLYPRSWSSLKSTAVISSTQYTHDEIALDISLLLQQLVERNGWAANNFVTFRIRNNPLRPVQSTPGSRIVYSGDLCGTNYNGGAYPCGPRLAATYTSRSTSSGNIFVSSANPTVANPLANLNAANDGQTHLLQETGAAPAHVVQVYTFAPLNGVIAATLFVRARVSGPETFQVQISRGGTTYRTVLTFTAADASSFTSKSILLDSAADIAGPSLFVRVQDNQASQAGSSSIEIDELVLFATYYNVDCIVSAPGPFSRCPVCQANPQQCATRTIVSAPQGTGSACPSLQLCQQCVPLACPTLRGEVTVTALVSVDSQQQWKAVQTSDVNSVDLYTIPNIPNARIGVAGKALTTPGSTLPLGFWVSQGFNNVPGVTQCVVREIVLTCPSGDAIANGQAQGQLACVNGLIPGPTTPATARFVVECT